MGRGRIIIICLSFLITQVCCAQEALFRDALIDASLFYAQKPTETNYEKLSFTNGQFFMQQYTGMFTDVRELKANMLFSKNKHRLGLHINTMKEGDFIAQNNFNLSYAIFIRISDKFKLGLEADAGFINLAIGEFKASNLESSYNIDSKIKSILYSKHHYLSMGIAHVNEPTMKLISYSITYPINYFVDYMADYSINKNVDTRNFARLSYDSFLQYQYAAGAIFNYKKSVGLGLSFQNLSDYVFLLDLHFYKEKEYTIDLVFGYKINSGLSSQTYTVPKVQVGLNFKRK